jgi:outer membrane protein OmpA-like peptidoglycan-associated protein
MPVLATLYIFALLQTPGDTLSVFFAFNQSSLLPAQAARIDSFLRVHGSARDVQLYGHCDDRGSDLYNDSLSLARAQSVERYLLSSLHPGAPRIQVKGLGKRQPLGDNRTEAERSVNRRVDITFDRPPVMPGPDLKVMNAPGAQPVMPPPDSIIDLPSAAALEDLFKDPGAMVGKRVILRDIHFNGGHHNPLPDSYAALNSLLKLMARQPGLEIEIQGFVCCLPDSIDALDLDTHVINLSEARAKFIYDYLRTRGIDTARMKYEGFGASQKLFPDETSEAQMKMNRRVQIKITAWKP